MKTLLALFVVAFILSTFAHGGECLEDTEEVLKVLQHADIEQFNNEIFCLYHMVGYYERGYEYFASPTVMDKIQKENESTRKLVYDLLPKFLESNAEMNRCMAIEALAYFRWPNSYELLAECDKDRPQRKAIIYAILGDKRAIQWIIDQYKAIDNQFKKNPIQSYSSKMTYLNALYHLASPEVLPFIDEIIKNPRPQNIKERAIKVKERILKLKS